MFTEAYNFFAHSTIRQAEYKDILIIVGFSEVIVESVNEPLDEDLPVVGRRPLKLIGGSDTRWLVNADCSERILMHYDALQVNTYFPYFPLNLPKSQTRIHLAIRYFEMIFLLLLKFIIKIKKIF